MSAPTVTVEGLSKWDGRLAALSDVSLTIRVGEVLGLIGPNGAGKTTLFECLAGVRPYDAGTIRFDGDVLPPRARASRIFYVPDAIAPWPSQTVRWALDFAVGFFGGRADRKADVIARLDLAPFLTSPIGTLSKGQRKRAVLGVGLLTPHPILLIDEPFDGLDLRQSRDVGAALCDHGPWAARCFSDHQISDAARMCDRFVLLSGGRVRGEGTIAELRGSRTQNPLNPNNPMNPSDLEEIVLALT
jgi:ABC-type multidrug transport system ATPase subunit